MSLFGNDFSDLNILKSRIWMSSSWKFFVSSSNLSSATKTPGERGKNSSFGQHSFLGSHVDELALFDLSFHYNDRRE